MWLYITHAHMLYYTFICVLYWIWIYITHAHMLYCTFVCLLYSMWIYITHAHMLYCTFVCVLYWIWLYITHAHMLPCIVVCVLDWRWIYFHLSPVATRILEYIGNSELHLLQLDLTLKALATGCGGRVINSAAFPRGRSAVWIRA